MALASCCRPSPLTDGRVGPGLSSSLQHCCRAGGPRPWTHTLEATLALEPPPSEELPSSLCVVIIANPARPPGGSAGKVARVSAAEPSWDRGPRRAHRLPPGVEGAEGQSAHTPHPGGEAGKVCSPHPGRGGDGQGAQSPTLGGRGGAGRGHSPARWPPSTLAPLGCTHGWWTASTRDSHWLLRAFNPASLSSQSFMR